MWAALWAAFAAPGRPSPKVPPRGAQSAPAARNALAAASGQLGTGSGLQNPLTGLPPTLPVVPNILLTARHDGQECALGTVSFDDNDASIYLRPISRRNVMYDYGCHTFAPGVASTKFQTEGQLRAAERPHISIHETGTCHVRTSAGKVASKASAEIGPLNAFTGEHVGTILCDDTAVLSKLSDVWPDIGARDEDAQPWNVTPPQAPASLRVAVFVSRRPQDARRGAHRFREERRGRRDGGVLFVALNAFAGPPLDGGHPTVGAIGGWDPGGAHDISRPGSLAFVRDVIAPTGSAET